MKKKKNEIPLWFLLFFFPNPINFVIVFFSATELCNLSSTLSFRPFHFYWSQLTTPISIRWNLLIFNELLAKKKKIFFRFDDRKFDSIVFKSSIPSNHLIGGKFHNRPIKFLLHQITLLNFFRKSINQSIVLERRKRKNEINIDETLLSNHTWINRTIQINC